MRQKIATNSGQEKRMRVNDVEGRERHSSIVNLSLYGLAATRSTHTFYVCIYTVWPRNVLDVRTECCKSRVVLFKAISHPQPFFPRRFFICQFFFIHTFHSLLHIMYSLVSLNQPRWNSCLFHRLYRASSVPSNTRESSPFFTLIRPFPLLSLLLRIYLTQSVLSSRSNTLHCIVTWDRITFYSPWAHYKNMPCMCIFF